MSEQNRARLLETGYVIKVFCINNSRIGNRYADAEKLIQDFGLLPNEACLLIHCRVTEPR